MSKDGSTIFFADSDNRKIKQVVVATGETTNLVANDVRRCLLTTLIELAGPLNVYIRALIQAGQEKEDVVQANFRRNTSAEKQ